MDYYKKTLYIARVDRNDRVLGPIERWKAHKEGVLHRGFTVGLIYKNFFICQHRKHPVFDGFLDLTASSHLIYKGGKLESNLEGVYRTLKREWNISKKDIQGSFGEKGKVYYRSSYGNFIEHEICYFFSARAKTIPQVNFEYAYGFSLLTLNDLKSKNTPFAGAIAPWVKEALKQNLF